MYKLLEPSSSYRPRDAAERQPIDTALSTYLANRLRLRAVQLAGEPVALTSGWEAYVYRFRLAGSVELPAPFHRPLVLRLYAGSGGLPRARREFLAQSHAFRAGYPAPEPLLLEENCRHLGGPFVVMEQTPGETLLDHLRGNWTNIFEVPQRLGQAHRYLHALSTSGLSLPADGFLERRLSELAQTVRTHQLTGLSAALRWLDNSRCPETPAARLLHLDFHPINLIARQDGVDVALDWSEADVGDIYADVATTILLLRHVAPGPLALSERLLSPVARWVLERGYRRSYFGGERVDEERLNYYLAWACLRRLAVYGSWQHSGPRCNGCKPGALGRVTPQHIAELEVCFGRLTGVKPELGDNRDLGQSADISTSG